MILVAAPVALVVTSPLSAEGAPDGTLTIDRTQSQTFAFDLTTEPSSVGVIDDRGFALNLPDILFPAPDEVLPPNATFLDVRFSGEPRLQYEIEYDGGFVPAQPLTPSILFGSPVSLDFVYDPRLNGFNTDLNIGTELREDASSFPAPGGVVPIEQSYLVGNSAFGLSDESNGDPALPLPLSAQIQVFIDSGSLPLSISAVRGTFSVSPEVRYFYLPAVPSPAALPAGLMLSIFAVRRRRLRAEAA